MSEFRNYKIFAVVAVFVLLAAACGPSTLPEDTISTAVALTVQAQNPTATLPASPSPAPTGTAMSLATVAGTVTGTALAEGPVEFCTASAEFAGETHPDGTIVQPGTVFTKTWQVRNTGTCTWDSRWQLVFTGGDLMDGAMVYNFPQPAEPGQTVGVPIILKAPAQGGSYTGEWMLKSPWGESFGVGQYSVPLVVSIVVGSLTPENRRTETVFDVTAVSYTVDRQCAPANTFYTITANITTNGPLNVVFSTLQSDGHRENNYRLNFTEATTKSFDWEWSQHRDSSPNPRWAQVIMTSPYYREFQTVVLPELCEFN